MQDEAVNLRKLSRPQLRKLMKAERGSIKGVAKELKITDNAVSAWLAGEFKSASIERTVRAWAEERR